MYLELLKNNMFYCDTPIFPHCVVSKDHRVDTEMSRSRDIAFQACYISHSSSLGHSRTTSMENCTGISIGDCRSNIQHIIYISGIIQLSDIFGQSMDSCL